MASLSWTAIGSIAELEHLLSDSNLDKNYLMLFKHSNKCSISSMAKNRLERSPNERIQYFIVDVIGQRDVSQRLAEITEVRHESPQAFLFHINGSGNKLIDVKSHLAINPDEIANMVGLEGHL